MPRPKRQAKSSKPKQIVRRGPFPHLQEWCHDKPFIVRFLAKIAAICPDNVADSVNMVRRGEIPADFKIPANPDEWHRNYTRTPRIKLNLIDMIFNGDAVAIDRLCRIHTALREVARTPPSVLLAQLQNMTEGERRFEWHRALYMCNDLDQRLDRILADADNPNHPPNERTLALITSPEIQFYFRVFGPCFVMYKKRPSQLLREARAGNIPALEKLLRLDASIAGVSPFREKLHIMAHDPTQQHTYHRLLSAMQCAPIRPAHAGTIKAGCGALLLAMTKRMKHCRLNKGDIRRLHDALAKDRGALRDESLPRTDYALRKSIDREAKAYQPLLDTATKASPKMSQ